LPSESAPAIERLQNLPDLDPEAITVRRIDAAERAAARVWTGNWQRMLLVIVVARGLIKPSMLDATERFAALRARIRATAPFPQAQ
jgi:hypothetical protein